MIRFLQQDNKLIKIVFGVIIFAAIIGMVITLVPGIFDNVGGGDNAVNYATVHPPGFFGRIFGASDTVTQADVQRIAADQTQRQHLPATLLPYFLPRAGQAAIQQAILKIEADQRGLGVSDSELADFLHKGQLGQVLFPNGQFVGQDQYMNIIQNELQMTVPQFEGLLKKEIELDRLQRLITGGVLVSDNEVRDSYRVSGTKVKFDYAVISAADIGKTLNPSDADLQAFFKQNAVRYTNAVPETRKIQYLSFGLDQIPGGKPQVSDADIQSYYNAHQANYQVKEQVKARHILIAVPDGADAKTDAAAKAKAEDILKQLKAGGDFAKLAEQYSDDPGSKTQGGQLPFMQPGQTVPEFDKALFSLQPGQLSDVVHTKFGYHIIQVQQHDKAHTQSLAEVRDQIVPILEQQKVASAEQSYASQLAAQAKKEGIEKTAAAHNLQTVTTDYLQQGGLIPGVSDGTSMLAGAFSTAKGAAPQTASTGDGYAVYQVVDVRAPHAPSFDEYKSHILDDYRQQRVPELLQAELAKLDQRAKQLNDLHKAAAEMNIPVMTSDLVGKDGQVPDVGAMSGPAAVAFNLPKGAISGPINAGQTGVVLSVIDKQEPSQDDMAKNFNTTRDSMLNDRREEVFSIYVSQLTDKFQNGGGVRMRGTNKAPVTGGPGAGLGL
jgi:peptidyl-prolyl cis-trans isomerase D